MKLKLTEISEKENFKIKKRGVFVKLCQWESKCKQKITIFVWYGCSRTHGSHTAPVHAVHGPWVEGPVSSNNISVSLCVGNWTNI
jgi:hypothetical protein